MTGKIRYYISGHGLGHASRTCQIINTLRQRHPQVAVDVVSDAAGWFFATGLDPGVRVRSAPTDVGVRQRDSLVMDEAATLVACKELLRQGESWGAVEAAGLLRDGITLVVADIPFLPFAAAARAGVPAVGVSNFSWDWIYAGLAEREPELAEIAAEVASFYSQAECLLQLPFAGPAAAFPRCESVPLVARQARHNPVETRKALGISPDMRVGLISFGGFGLSDFDFSALALLPQWLFLTEAGLAGAAPNLRPLAAGSYWYPDLVACADVVITKPGYGIVAEAIAAGTAVLYTRRGDFREQQLLIDGLQRYTRAQEIDNTRLRSGDWGESLEALCQRAMPVEQLPTHGDVFVADRLAAMAVGGGH